MSVADESTVLSSWKDIARYLGKGVRTVQRWEQHLGLPVRRPAGASQKSAVLLHREDVDAWLATRFVPRTVAVDKTNRIPEVSNSVRNELRQALKTAHELRDAHMALTQQIADSIRLLNERCSVLTAQSTQSPWRTTPRVDPGSLGTGSPTANEHVA